jgi:hypothetical protein
MRSIALLLWIAAVAAVVAAGAVLSDVGPGPGDETPSRPAASPPQTARAFADSLGVNVHLSYNNTRYADSDRVRATLEDLGVRHVRDGVVPNRPDDYRALNALAAAGIRSTLIVGPPRTTTPRELVQTVKARLLRAAEALEGPNEYDLSGDSGWKARLSAYQRELFRGIKADGELRQLPVYGPTFARSDRSVLRDLKGSLDGSSIHPYPGGGPPEAPIATAVKETQELSGRSAVIASETGYHNALNSNSGQPSVTEAVAADYLPRTFLSAFADGVQRTFWYELIDLRPDPDHRNAEENFGLVRNDFDPKPAYFALRNLAALARHGSEREPRRRPLSVKLTGDAGRPQQLLLQKTDNTYLLALWREDDLSPSSRRELDEHPRRLEVELPRQAARVAVHRPSRSASAVAVVRSARQLPVDLAGDAVVLEIRFPG